MTANARRSALASSSALTLPWVPEVIIIIFFASEASEQRGEVASTRRKAPRLPSEPVKRLIFSPTIRQRASGTRVRSHSRARKIFGEKKLNVCGQTNVNSVCPISRTLQFSKLPISRTNFHFPWIHVYFSVIFRKFFPRFLKPPNFSNQFSFPLEVRGNRDSRGAFSPGIAANKP